MADAGPASSQPAGLSVLERGEVMAWGKRQGTWKGLSRRYQTVHVPWRLSSRREVLWANCAGRVLLELQQTSTRIGPFNPG